MATPRIDTLFASDIRRRIEEVIKVDQTDEQVLRDEISEYVVTDAIKRHYTEVFDRYAATPGSRHEGIAVWVSGFFGSGKSSFAKYLGLALANRSIAGAGGGSASRAAGGRPEGGSPAPEHQRADPDRGGDLRRFDGPGDPDGQPDPH